MKILGNLIWLIFGGIFIAIEYLIASLLLMITIVGIPFGLQTLKLASLAIWIALTHVIFGLLLTIIGIPFGKQHFKLASVALSPFGKKIRST